MLNYKTWMHACMHADMCTHCVFNCDFCKSLQPFDQLQISWVDSGPRVHSCPGRVTVRCRLDPGPRTRRCQPLTEWWTCPVGRMEWFDVWLGLGFYIQGHCSCSGFMDVVMVMVRVRVINGVRVIHRVRFIHGVRFTGNIINYWSCCVSSHADCHARPTQGMWWHDLTCDLCTVSAQAKLRGNWDPLLTRPLNVTCDTCPFNQST